MSNTGRFVETTKKIMYMVNFLCPTSIGRMFKTIEHSGKKSAKYGTPKGISYTERGNTISRSPHGFAKSSLFHANEGISVTFTELPRTAALTLQFNEVAVKSPTQIVRE
jgi:hypothetical protein